MQTGIYSLTFHSTKEERSQSKNLSFPLKKWGKEQQRKKKDIINIRLKINKTEIRNNREKINKAKNDS